MKTDGLQAFCKEHDIPLFFNEPMAEHTTFKAGGNAACFAVPLSEQSLVKLFTFTDKMNIAYQIIGKGSNILVRDEGFDGLIISTQNQNKIEWQQNGVLVADCGVSLAEIAAAAMKCGYTGLEFASGIPGTVGGAVYMNAGAYDGEMSNIVSAVSCFDVPNMQMMTLNRDELDFAYRHSWFQEHLNVYILAATIKLKEGKTSEIKAKMEDFGERRRSKQPLNHRSAGSTFKRPQGTFAAKLIEDCGLKGYRIGDAQVSEKHAGFVINRGEASASDIISLMDHIEKTVLDKTGIALEREVRII